HRDSLSRPYAALRGDPEYRVRDVPGAGVQPLAAGGVAARGAGTLWGGAGRAAESGGGGGGDPALRKGGAHRRRLSADGGGQSALGASQVRSDHGRGAGDEPAGLPA